MYKYRAMKKTNDDNLGGLYSYAHTTKVKDINKVVSNCNSS